MVICLSAAHKEGNKEREWSWLIYSYFETSCRKKCKRQSRKVVLWLVLGSLFSKEIWKNGTRGHGRRYVGVCLRRGTKVGLTATVSGTVYWSYPISRFGIVACIFFSGNLLWRNSCILLSHRPQQWKKSLSLTETSGWWSRVRWWDCGINPNWGCFGVKRINPKIIGKREGIAYLSAQICVCTGWPRLQRRYGLRQGLRDFKFYGLRQAPGKCVFKLGSSFARIEKMAHCFLVDHSVFFIPREDKALPSIQILFTELQSHLPFCPARDDTPRFFVFIFVATVSAYYDQHIVIWKTIGTETCIQTVFSFFDTP